jgi:4-hydroxy-tetrahydrodipicolinate reductase
MPKINIILVGATGKMGHEIISLLATHDRAKLLTGVMNSNKAELHAPKKKMSNCVLIDFSVPAGFTMALKYCCNNRIPFVSGTTGLTAKHFSELKKASKKIPVLWAPNMSLGVNLLFNLVEQAGHTFANFDMQIEESHHKHKKDSPSGTAIALQKKVEAASKKKLPPILSTRGGGVIGLHTLKIMGEEEVLTIEHEALNRKVFARGAIEAAVWLSDKKRGLYDMKDFINAR